MMPDVPTPMPGVTGNADFTEPASLSDARSRRVALTDAVAGIQDQLAEGRHGRTHRSMSDVQYDNWRARALRVLRSKQLQLGMLKKWMHEHRHLDEGEAGEPPEGRYPRSVAEAAAITLALARRQKGRVARLEAQVVALAEALRLAGGDPDSIMGDTYPTEAQG